LDCKEEEEEEEEVLFNIPEFVFEYAEEEDGEYDSIS
jgi:hypothetical protein